ncbi:mucin-binding protein [Limosilactobacillus fastidiosus]|uniref:Mub B2-like domain-containing protein n=1 Tax=Limosilactobacillus fastidiosus TaxID=2759855 RepID=A0A7W3YC16_9LACO|nr:hypothetical protein [Limosilactobacillus fastidiosus]MBB1062443.1 hypothetical protein [Limosilactobacillus fastidiosus]MBB1085606.1 hypothetical protein [Limosilactobacillus fastidiosus]MCD7083517.1 hypothetical protein [Limosilactobacillus fastidiosus]MCD7086059.1 hypothetical protein [Limosilactobacillus fastidiosus]MCD7114297.1 hypothetical protein [Limosilactobacillus fastidiosus]
MVIGKQQLTAQSTRTIILVHVDGTQQVIKQTVRFQRSKVPVADGRITYSQWICQPGSPKEWAEFDAPEIEGCAPDRAFLPSEEVQAWTPDSKVVIVYNRFDNERLDDRYTKTQSRPPLIHRPVEEKKSGIPHGLGLRIAGLTSLFGLRRAN